MSDETKPDQSDTKFEEQHKILDRQEVDTLCDESRRSLRIWFLAYAVGGTAIFVSTEGAWAAVRASALATVAFVIAALCFLPAIAIQILAQIYNKDHWQDATLTMQEQRVRMKELREAIEQQQPAPPPREPYRWKRMPRFFIRFDSVWADLLTLGLLFAATVIVIVILLAQAPNRPTAF